MMVISYDYTKVPKTTEKIKQKGGVNLLVRRCRRYTTKIILKLLKKILD